MNISYSKAHKIALAAISQWMIVNAMCYHQSCSVVTKLTVHCTQHTYGTVNRYIDDFITKVLYIWINKDILNIFPVR